MGSTLWTTGATRPVAAPAPLATVLSARLTVRLPAAALALALAGCGSPDPRSVDEYAADPILREAALSRCNLDRLSSRDDPDCINARRAAARVAAAAEAERRAELEAESEARRDARRRQLEAEAAASREAERAARDREMIEWIPDDSADGSTLREVVDDERPLSEAPVPESGSTPVEASDTQDASAPPRKD